MRPTHCPKCRQVTTPDDAGRCLLCGFDLAEAHRRTLSLYIVTVGVTLSTLVLGGIVLATEKFGTPPQVSSRPVYIVYGFLFFALVVGLVAVFGVEPALKRRPGSVQVFRGLLLQAALAEMVAVLGLVLYFMLGSVKWFTIFLAISWVVFTIIGIKLGDSVAEFERRLVGELERERQEREHLS